MIQKDLAKTLELIANEGAKAFYSGSIADLITEEMKRGNGEITLQDLKNYQAISRDVIRGKYREYTILAAPPPSSGGTCIVEALNILESFNLRELDRYDPKTIHLIAEAMRRAFADRAMHLGDPDFTDIPKHLTEKAYAAGLAKEIDINHATSSHLVGPPITEGYESLTPLIFLSLILKGWRSAIPTPSKRRGDPGLLSRVQVLFSIMKWVISIGFPVRRTPLVELELNPISCKVGSGCSAHSALLFSNVMGSW